MPLQHGRLVQAASRSCQLEGKEEGDEEEEDDREVVGMGGIAGHGGENEL